MSSNQGTTAHGLRILAWLLTMCIGLSIAVRAAGLKYVQGIIWPTDLHSFRLMEIPPDSVDVVVMGSSRASFAITPSSLDLCLGRELGRPTRTYNLDNVAPYPGAPADWTRFHPWRAPGEAPVLDPCGLAGGSTHNNDRAGQ